MSDSDSSADESSAEVRLADLDLRGYAEMAAMYESSEDDAQEGDAPGGAQSGGELLPFELPPDVNVHERRPEYRLEDGINAYKQMALLVQLFTHVVDGQPIPDVFAGGPLSFPEQPPVFHVDKDE